MKNNTKKTLALLVLGLFVFAFAFSAVGFVSAAERNSSNPGGGGIDFNLMKSLFDVDNWLLGEEFSSYVAKVLFMVLLVLIIQGVAGFVPGIEDKGAIKWIFAVIVGYLGMAYITPDEIYAMMISYSAMGFAIGTIIPFIVIAAFTYQLATKEGKPSELVANKWIAKGVWLVFSLYILYKIISIWKAPELTSNGFMWMLVIVLVISVVIFLSVRKIFKILRSTVTQEKFDKYKEMNETQISKLKTDVEALEEAATS